MGKSALNIMIRTVKRRMGNGEDLEDILKSYPKLTMRESELIREAVSGRTDS